MAKHETIKQETSYSTMTTAAAELANQRTKQILDAIDSLRHMSLGKKVKSTQIVVIGDQSSGKSSVLEAIADVRFPSSKGTCTRYPMEIVMRRGSKDRISVSVVLDEGTSSTSMDTKKPFEKFNTINHLKNLPEIVKIADEVLGIKSDGNGRSGFSSHALRIEISGPDKPQLTLVDLPGIIQWNGSASKEDIHAVKSMAIKYCQNPRAIVLAIVSGTNDIQNQTPMGIAKDAGAFDRTLGVITKLDVLGDSDRIEDAMEGFAEVGFGLGFHVLRNRNGDHEADITSQERDALEEEFFTECEAWSAYERKDLGIAALRSRLRNLLTAHLRTEVPEIIKEIALRTSKDRAQLEKLGPALAEVADKRVYLMDICATFCRTARDAFDGHYEDLKRQGINKTKITHQVLASPLEDKNMRRRLLAVLELHNTWFHHQMRLHGCGVIFDGMWAPEPCLQLSETESPAEYSTLKANDVVQETKKHDVARDWAVERMQANRGREMPGSVNPALMQELFNRLSQNWAKLAGNHIKRVHTVCYNFFQQLLVDITTEEVSHRLHGQKLLPAMRDRLHKCEQELQWLQKDLLQPPNSQDPSYVAKRDAYTSQRRAHHPDQYSVEQETALAALDAAKAYYDVQLTWYIESVKKSVIGRYLLDNLDEAVLNSRMVVRMEDNEIHQLVAEEETTAKTRAELQKRLEEADKVIKELEG